MIEKITLCGDNCIECPRYNAHTDEKLKQVVEASDYAIKVINMKYPNDMKAVWQERKWQIDTMNSIKDIWNK